MPLRGLRRSPLTRPRNERRESRLRRSSWVRKSAESSSWPAGLPAALVAALAAAALALPPALQPLAVAAALFHRAHLVERALHRFHRLVGLPALERLHALVGVARPVALPLPAVLASEPLHLAQQLSQLLRRDLLVRVESAPQRLGLLEDHAGLALGEVALEVRQPLERIEHAEALVALLEERVEVGRAPAQGGVLEHRGQVARLALPAAAQARAQIALLHVGALHLVAPGGLLALRLLGLPAAVDRRLLLVLVAGDREVGQTG